MKKIMYVVAILLMSLATCGCSEGGDDVMEELKAEEVIKDEETIKRTLQYQLDRITIHKDTCDLYVTILCKKLYTKTEKQNKLFSGCVVYAPIFSDDGYFKFYDEDMNLIDEADEYNEIKYAKSKKSTVLVTFEKYVNNSIELTNY